MPSRLRASSGSRSSRTTTSGFWNFAIFSATAMTVSMPTLPAAP